MKINFEVELTKEQIEFLIDDNVWCLFHCCGQGMTTSDINRETQKIFEESIYDSLPEQV